jgi:ribonuclease-3
MKSRENPQLEEILGYRFSRPELLQQALTHTSHAREAEKLPAGQERNIQERAPDNEQLEFLGDAVLSLVTTEELFHRFPHFHEGELSKLRAHLVSERHLVRAAQKLNIGSFLRLGRGEEKSGGRNKTALLVDALEAILGAVYLDSGLPAVKKIILSHIVSPELAALESGPGVQVSDFKSTLQETLQANGRTQLSYDLVEEHGPEHNKTFVVEARLRTRTGEQVEFVGRATGPTKKRAEQDAARQVLEYLASLPPLGQNLGRVHARERAHS